MTWDPCDGLPVPVHNSFWRTSLAMPHSFFWALYSPSVLLSIGLFFFQHYKRSIHDSFEQHPNANYLVILEEDLDVSIDILSYFKQLLPVYEKDASVYCISAWNDQVWHPSCV